MTRAGRRRAASPGIVTIFWRDIPAQITVTTPDGANEKVLLEPRFQHAIDRAAHVAGLTETQSYVEQWRRVAAPLEGDPTELAQATADAIHSDYPRDRLEALVAAGGIEPDGGPDQ
ncbi:MAG: virulence factor [Acidimicrobiales bacterium]